MDEEGERLINQRIKRQLVYPFLEIEFKNRNDKFELLKGETDMTEVVEIAEDGRLLSIKEVTEFSPQKNLNNTEE
jgi:phage gp29-like protein